MCDPVTMTMAGIQAFGQYQHGQAAKGQADIEAAEMDRQAAYERAIAQGEAAQIRRAGGAARGETLAATVASGVKVGEGSALDAERQVMTDYAQDEAMALLNADLRAKALESSASNRRRAGRAARRAAVINVATSLLSSGAQGLQASGWRSRGPGFSGTQAPAPVVNRSVRGGP